jgi:transposase
MLLTDGGGCFSKTMPGPHTARETTYFLSQNNINVFTSPSKSPDLNLIEHL